MKIIANNWSMACVQIKTLIIVMLFVGSAKGKHSDVGIFETKSHIRIVRMIAAKDATANPICVYWRTNFVSLNFVSSGYNTTASLKSDQKEISVGDRREYLRNNPNMVWHIEPDLHVSSCSANVPLKYKSPDHIITKEIAKLRSEVFIAATVVP